MHDYTFNGLTLKVENEWDERVVQEVATCYQLDKLNLSGVKTAVDIGAHIGSFSRTLLQLKPTVQIVCVEPNPLVTPLLTKNATANMDIVTGYYSEVEGSYTLAAHDFASAAVAVVQNEVVPHYANDPDRHHFMPLSPELRVTMGDILKRRGWSRINLLKLDCEGAEFGFFASAPSDILRRIDIIVAEVHCDVARFMRHYAPRLIDHRFDISATEHPSNQDLCYLIAKAR